MVIARHSHQKESPPSQPNLPCRAALPAVPTRLFATCLGILLLSVLTTTAADTAGRGGGLSTRTNDARLQFTLQAENYWRLRPIADARFDASGLLLRDGQLLTLADRGPELYTIALTNSHEGHLQKTKFFPYLRVAEASSKRAPHYDCEGIGSDSNHWIYICEEGQREIYRSSPDATKIEALKIDWSPVRKFFRGGGNASFEGIAIGNGKLYVANERDAARIIVVDLPTLTVEDSFYVDSSGFAFGGPHYSDLCFFDGKLFVLDRNHRCILEVNPALKKVDAEYSFGLMELNEDMAYTTDYPTGTMEGLAVDQQYFWLITDNNGKGRIKAPNDIRPTLFRCNRPRK